MTTEKFSHHTKCENCGSRDNRGVWLNPDDTIHHTYCFGCHEYSASGETTEKPKPKILKDMITGEYEPLSKRRINEDTCKVFDYDGSRRAYHSLSGQTKMKLFYQIKLKYLKLARLLLLKQIILSLKKIGKASTNLPKVQL